MPIDTRTLCALTLLAAPLSAQPSMVRLTLGGGTATDLRGIRSGSWQIAPSATLFPLSNLRLLIGGRGTRYTSREWSVAGEASVDGRVALAGPVALALAAGADLTRASYGATYLQADALPSLQVRSGPVTLWGGARVAGARTSVDQSPDSPVPLPSGDQSLRTRSTIGPAFGGSVDLVRGPEGALLRLSYREERGGSDEGRIVDRVAGAMLSSGPVGLWGTLGLRSEAGVERGFGGGRLVVSLDPMIALFAAAEAYPGNPLLGTPGGRAFSAGLSLRAVAPVRERGPKPAGIPDPAPGLTRLSIRAASAARVDVAGDWNQWRPVPLARGSQGIWYGDFAIAPGLYRYAFRIDGARWEVPEGVAAVNDGFGGKSAWLSVRKPADPK
ncbi:MAG TPA: glycogen-binding domain-containing protein [Gemmatimonadales bacterium]|nr:glycogen-binding domain-containing protein [Gemmatimonadales bacterium]